MPKTTTKVYPFESHEREMNIEEIAQDIYEAAFAGKIVDIQEIIIGVESFGRMEDLSAEISETIFNFVIDDEIGWLNKIIESFRKAGVKIKDSSMNLGASVQQLSANGRTEAAKGVIDVIDMDSYRRNEKNNFEFLAGILNSRKEEFGNSALEILQHALKSGFDAGASSGLIERDSEHGHHVEKDAFSVISQQKGDKELNKSMVLELIKTGKVRGLQDSLADFAIFLIDEGRANPRDMVSRSHFFSNIIEKGDDLGNSFQDSLAIFTKNNPNSSDVLGQLSWQHEINISGSNFLDEELSSNKTARSRLDSLRGPDYSCVDRIEELEEGVTPSTSKDEEEAVTPANEVKKGCGSCLQAIGERLGII